MASCLAKVQSCLSTHYSIVLWVCLFIFLLSGQPVNGQTICLDKYNALSYSFKEKVSSDEFGRILVATYQLGLVILDGYDTEYFQGYDKEFPNVYYEVCEMTWLDDGSLLLGVYKLGTVIIHKDSVERFVHTEDRNEGLYNRHIEAFCQHGDTLLVGCTNGELYLVDIATRSIINQLNTIDTFPTIIKNDIQKGDILDIKQDQNNPCLYWMGGHGLFRYNICQHTIEHFPQGRDFVSDQSNTSTGVHTEYGMFEIELYGSKVYCSSWGGGLLVFDTVRKQWDKILFEPYTDMDVLDENVLRNLSRINDTILYAGIRDDVFFYDMKNQKRIDPQSIIDGAISISGQYASGCYILDNQAFFGDNNKFCAYDLHDDYKTKEVGEKHLYIKSAFADGINLNVSEGIIPRYKSNIEKDFRNIRIDFRCPFVSDRDSIAYWYKLQGYDSDWVNIGSEHTVQYNQLSGGDYQFFAKAQLKNSAGDQWVTLIQPYSFHIEKTLTETLWFRWVMGFGSVGLLGFVFYFFRKNAIDKQKTQIKHLTELQEVKLAAFRAQINPHFLFNSLTSINNYIMYEDPRKASRYLTKFSHLMRKILNYSSQNLISLEEEIKILKLYTEMENTRFDNTINFEFHIHHPLLPASTFIPSMILQPFVENAIHHGMKNKNGKGNVIINIRQMNKDQIQISIKDDGIGREMARQLKDKNAIKNRSMGIDITSKRVDMIKDLFGLDTEIVILDLKHENGAALGTEVQLTLPMIVPENRKKYEISG